MKVENPVLLIGASGAVGLPTIAHLVSKGVNVRALTSSEESANRLQGAGVRETIVGDMRNRSDLLKAMNGVSALLFTAPRFIADEAEIGAAVIAAAVESKVPRFVLTSVLHPELGDLPHHRNKLSVQEVLLGSGLEFVILQPAMFMQNLRIEWPTILTKGVYSRPYSPDRKMATVDVEEVGEAAAIALTQPHLIGGTFELCGPDRLTHHEMAATIADIIGSPVKAIRRDPADWENWASGAGWTAWARSTYLAMCLHYDAHGYAGGNPCALKAIIGREPSSYRAFTRRFADQMARFARSD